MKIPNCVRKRDHKTRFLVKKKKKCWLHQRVSNVQQQQKKSDSERKRKKERRRKWKKEKEKQELASVRNSLWYLN